MLLYVFRGGISAPAPNSTTGCVITLDLLTSHGPMSRLPQQVTILMIVQPAPGKLGLQDHPYWGFFSTLVAFGITGSLSAAWAWLPIYSPVVFIQCSISVAGTHLDRARFGVKLVPSEVHSSSVAMFTNH